MCKVANPANLNEQMRVCMCKHGCLEPVFLCTVLKELWLRVSHTISVLILRTIAT